MAIITQPIDSAEAAVPAPAVEVETWRRWLIMFILLTGGIKTTLAFTTVVPGLQLIAEHFRGAGDNVLGAQFVVTMAPIGMAVTGLFAGWIVNAGGLRRTLFISLGIASFCGLSQLWIQSFPALLASRFLLGCSVVVVDITLTTILAAQFAGATRSQLIGFRQGISSAGTVSTMLLAGIIADHYGWRAPAWMFMVPVVSLLLSFIAFNKPIVFTRQMQTTERFSILQLWPIYVLCLVMSMAHTMPSFQMPFLLKEHGVTSAELVSRVPALSSFISIIAALAFGYVYARAGRWTLVMACTFMGVGFMGVGISPTYNLILACVVVEGIGAGWTMPFFSNRLLDRVTPAQRSQAMGFLFSSLFLGHFLNPIATAPLRTNFGIHETFLVVGGILVFMAAAFGVWSLVSRGKNTII